MSTQDKIVLRISMFCLMGLVYRSFADHWHNDFYAAGIVVALTFWAALGVYLDQ